MSTGALDLPLLHDLIPHGIEYGTVLLVEFEPQSCWFDLALSLVAQAVRAGAKTDLHLFQRKPDQVKASLTRAGLDVGKLQQTDQLRILDSYTLQTGIGVPEEPSGGDSFLTQSLRVADWGSAAKRQIIEGIPESEKDRFHVDENISILSRYNREEEIVDYWRTRAIPRHKERRTIFVNAVAVGVTSEGFHRQFESMADGVLDCRSREQDDRIQQQIRVRNLRGRSPDSRWQTVSVVDGEVRRDRSAGPPGTTGAGPE
ncbi:MAG TPA: hypothetical protein VIZ68_00310 [Thermoplasmata archaeon]